MWYLVIIAWWNMGITSQVIEFDSKEACSAAFDALRKPPKPGEEKPGVNVMCVQKNPRLK